MPRRTLKKFLPNRHALAERWFMRPFGSILHDPVYWTAHRRGVVRAFAIGLFICFIPLPIHLLIAPIAAIALRANVPVAIVTTFLVNPFTAVPTFFTAYWIGVHLTGSPLIPQFTPNWDWVTTHLTQIWKPLLVGCLFTGVAIAAAGYALLSIIWRWRVTHRYQTRSGRLRKNCTLD
jgi:uncharacterized protein (DUF2062 family)